MNVSWELYKNVVVNHKKTSMKRRYSATSDVLSYRRCPRQYAFQSERGFVPSLPNQIFIGTIIHEVLDRAHGHFAGKRDPSTRGSIPSDDNINDYFGEVENALRSQGMRVPGQVKEFALKILKSFNRIEGPSLYPRVIDTEHRLQAERQDYILYGVVDVLLSGGDKNGNEQKEIWDYKGTKRPKNDTAGKKRMEDYVFQMQVYANLYKLRNLEYPSKAFIYFVGELQEEPKVRPQDALLEIDLEEEKIARALSAFDSTVDEINVSRESQNWPPAENGSESAGKETCVICDLRWNCPAERSKHQPRYLGEKN
jgi:putative RecB family exonuclease